MAWLSYGEASIPQRKRPRCGCSLKQRLAFVKSSTTSRRDSVLEPSAVSTEQSAIERELRNLARPERFELPTSQCSPPQRGKIVAVACYVAYTTDRFRARKIM